MMMDYDEFLKTNFPLDSKLAYEEIDKEQYLTEEVESDVVSADLFIENDAYCFKLNNFEYWCDDRCSIDELKQEIHEQIDFYVDECLKAALGRKG